MHSFVPFGSLFGLGAPELIVLLVILLVLFSGYVRSVGGVAAAGRGSDPGLTPHERQILMAVGAFVVIGVALVIGLGVAR